MAGLSGSQLTPHASAAAVAARTVYVIDDHLAVRQSLDMLLGTFGIASRSFASAAEFLDEVALLPPAPLLLDLTMPEMNGVELLQVLVDRKINWPVLIMTGMTGAPVVYQALELGALSILEKPFSAEVLQHAVSAALTAMVDLQIPQQGPI